MKLLKQSTTKTIKVGPVEDTSGNRLTGNIPQSGVRLSKHHGDFAQPSSSSGAIHDEFGYFDVNLNTTDTNTLGDLKINLGSGNYRLREADQYVVVTTDIYDAFYNSGGLIGIITSGVRSAISGDQYIEPSTVAPSSTSSLAAKINYMYKATINKQEQTASTYKLYNSDNSTIGQQAPCTDDGTTFTRGKIISG